MGAGAVKAAQQGEDPESDTPCTSQIDPNKMSCEGCAVSLNIFKRKKNCIECGKVHCIDCLNKVNIGKDVKRRCRKCQVLVSGNFTRSDLFSYKIKDLRSFLNRRKVPIVNCTEKADLIDLLLSISNNSEYLQQQHLDHQRAQVLQQRAQEIRQSSSTRTSNTSTTSSSTTDSSSQQNIPRNDPREPGVSGRPTGPPPSYDETTQAENQPSDNVMDQEPSAQNEDTPADQDMPTESPAPGRRNRFTLNKVKDLESIEDLTIIQLKEVLATNYVNYKGCCEKWELVERVQRLWQDHQENINKAEEIEEEEYVNPDVDSSDMCKICMSKVIDCVLLECGHMVTCTDCSKQMAECPICRQYVSRVVRVFKT